MYNLLIVEDDATLNAGLVDLLSDEGFCCHAFLDVEAAQAALAQAHILVPDLCVLDRNLPGASGDQLCKSLRRNYPVLPILMLSARDQVSDRVTGLKIGADDYLVKPFVAEELVARLRAMCRRLPWLTELTSGGFRIANRRIDSHRLLVTYPCGREVNLVQRELQLLELLHRNRGRVVSRDQLYDRGWGRSVFPSSRALDQYMVGLRQKIGDAEWMAQTGSHLIESVRGIGYRLTY